MYVYAYISVCVRYKVALLTAITAYKGSVTEIAVLRSLLPFSRLPTLPSAQYLRLDSPIPHRIFRILLIPTVVINSSSSTPPHPSAATQREAPTLQHQQVVTAVRRNPSSYTNPCDTNFIQKQQAHPGSPQAHQPERRPSTAHLPNTRGISINQSIKVYSQPSNTDNKWGTPEENQKS